MECTQCGYVNRGGKFCIKCGTRLEIAAGSDFGSMPATDVAANAPTGEGYGAPVQFSVQEYAGSQGANTTLQKVKDVVLTYLHFAKDALQKPVAIGLNPGRGTFVHGVITFVLFAIFTPLFTFSMLKQLLKFNGFGFFEPTISFGAVVVKPAFYYALFLFVIALIMLGVLYVSKVQVSYKQVVARFGALLVVPAALMVASLVISLLHARFFLKIASLLSGLGMVAAVIAIVIAVSSFKREGDGGLDRFYVVLLTFFGIGLVLALLGDYMAHSFVNTIQDSFGINL